MENYDWLFTIPGLQGIGFLGMLMNFFKKKIKGETLTEIHNYFSNNFKATITAIIITAITTAAYQMTLGTGMPADILTVFGLGYMCDSAFNKWDKPQ